ncbi:MAG: YARHG domain-containing protein, partial [Oscillospiraceae bacterium]|nr:YARHG domain-containing protein [Oscillospiraceae bacterium]
LHTPDSNSRVHSEAGLEGLSDRELMLARNEIFAHHGFIFTTQWSQGYFLTQGWYRGTTPASQFDSSVFNSYERANVDLILRIEAERAGG